MRLSRSCSGGSVTGGEEANQGGGRRTGKLHLAHLSTRFSARPACIRAEQDIQFGTTHSHILCHPGLTRQRQDRDPVRHGNRLRKPREPNEYWIPAFAGMTRLMGYWTTRLNAVAVIELWRIDPVSGRSGLGEESRALKNLRQPKQKSRVVRPGFSNIIAVRLRPRGGRCPSCFQRCRFHRPSPWSGRCHRGR